jgi:hypothetical protein
MQIADWSIIQRGGLGLTESACISIAFLLQLSWGYLWIKLSLRYSKFADYILSMQIAHIVLWFINSGKTKLTASLTVVTAGAPCRFLQMVLCEQSREWNAKMMDISMESPVRFWKMYTVFCECNACVCKTCSAHVPWTWNNRINAFHISWMSHNIIGVVRRRIHCPKLYGGGWIHRCIGLLYSTFSIHIYLFIYIDMHLHICELNFLLKTAFKSVYRHNPWLR